MKRLLLYVHFNKYNGFSDYVYYQLTQLRPLFAKVVFISNSSVSDKQIAVLENEHLIDYFIQRDNKGYDFGAWHDGMAFIGFNHLNDYDSITVMNDTCFGPLWNLEDYFIKYESDSNVDFWGMTNHASVEGRNISIPEHLQSYFISFKSSMIDSDAFRAFWQNVKNFEDVQEVIDNYEIKYTTLFRKAGFSYASVLDTVPIHEKYVHRNFTIHYPHVLMDSQVPFIKVKTFDLSRHLSPYLLQEIENRTDYPISLILDHMSTISLPTPSYLLDRKVLVPTTPYSGTKKVAIHLHVYYVDLLPWYLKQFANFEFRYDLFVTTDTADKQTVIDEILVQYNQKAKIIISGNKGRDIIPMLKLKQYLSSYDYIGHFHTKKSPEYPYWVGESWLNELGDMLIKPASDILHHLEINEKLGLVIADIPSFFRYTKIVDPWNENKFADDMNVLWSKMNLGREIDFNQLSTFIMSYGTFIWFKYDALSPLFEVTFSEEDIPEEPLPQHTVLHAIERILVYLAWAREYDYGISRNTNYITPFVDNTIINIRPELMPNTYVNFDHIGGLKGALKYIILGPASAVKYIIKRLLGKR